MKGQYGVSFSPDNSKLYVCSDGLDASNHQLYILLQYDMHAGGTSEIIASRQSIIINNPKTNIPHIGIFGGWSSAAKGMSLAPDGKLYISGNSSHDEHTDDILVVVNKPNSPGFDCDVNYVRFNFDNGHMGFGLPNFIQSYFNGIDPVEFCKPSVKVYPNPTPGKVMVAPADNCATPYRFEVVNALGQIVKRLTTITEPWKWI